MLCELEQGWLQKYKYALREITIRKGEVEAVRSKETKRFEENKI